MGGSRAVRGRRCGERPPREADAARRALAAARTAGDGDGRLDVHLLPSRQGELRGDGTPAHVASPKPTSGCQLSQAAEQPAAHTAPGTPLPADPLPLEALSDSASA